MGGKKGNKQPNRGGGKHQPADRGKSSRVSWILVGLAVAVAVAGIYLVFTRHDHSPRGVESASDSRSKAATRGSADFQTIVGRWMRPDGGYIISVRSVDPDGLVDAGYFNPRPINVSRAEASAEGNTVKLFIELQAAGYPGSTYELIYDPGNDALVGVYFQAAMQQRFQVVFVRTE